MRRLFVLAFVVLLGCARDPAELGPVEALSAFLSSVEQSTHSPEERKLAYAWVDAQSRAALEERAELAASLAGRAMQPWEMLVPGRVSFAGKSLAGVRMKAVVDGDRAVVQIPVENRGPIEVPMVREEGRWRVVLGLSPSTSE